MDILIVSVLLVLILILGYFLQRPYFRFPIDEDFGFYTYLPYFYKRGVRIIRDFWIVFPFTIVSFYSFIYKSFGNNPENLRRALFVYNVFNAFAIFCVSEYLFGSETALLAVLIYTLYSSSPRIGYYSCNAETLYILPIALAVYAFSLGAMEEKPIYFAISGWFFSAAFLLKIVNIVPFVIFTFFLVSLGQWENAFNITGNFIIVLVLYAANIAIKYWGQNRLCWSQHYARIKITLSYIEKDFKRLLERISMDLKPIFRETSIVWFLPFLFIVSFFIHEKTLSEVIVLLWAVSIVLVLFLQRAFWMYHYIPLVHIFSILSAATLFKFYATVGFHSQFISVLVTTVLSLLLFQNIYHKSRFFYLYRKDKRLIDFPKGDQYFFIPVVAEYIKKNSSPEDYIYVWGSLVHLYVLAERRSCEGFLYHYMRPYTRHHEPLFDEVLGGIIAKKPKFIIMSRPDFDMKIIGQITGLSYELQRVFFNRYRVYLLKRQVSKSMEIEKLTWDRKKELMEDLSPGPMDARVDDYYIEKGMYDTAMKEFMEAIALNPHDMITKMGLAQLYRKQYRYNEALKIYIDTLKAGKLKGWIYQEMAFTHIEMENFTESLKYFKKALSKGCSKEWGYLGMGMAYRGMGNCSRAFECFEKAHNINPGMESLHLKKGITYRKLEKHTEAFVEFEAERRHQIGITYNQLKEYDKAFKEFKKALSIDPFKEWIHFEMGVAYKNLGENSKALSEFEKECKLNPKNLLASYNYSSILKLLGKEGSAVEGFLEILKNNDASQLQPGSNFHLGEIYFNKSNYEKAGEFFRACLELKPSHKKAAEYLETIKRQVAATKRATAQ